MNDKLFVYFENVDQYWLWLATYRLKELFCVDQVGITEVLIVVEGKVITLKPEILRRWEDEAQAAREAREVSR